MEARVGFARILIYRKFLWPLIFTEVCTGPESRQKQFASLLRETGRVTVRARLKGASAEALR